MRAVAVVLCSLALACSPSPVSAADGDLDAGFGTGGVVTEPLAGLPQGSGVVLQDDGKVVSVTIDDAGLKLYRYDSTGTLDGTFGVGEWQAATSQAPPHLSPAHVVIHRSLASPWDACQTPRAAGPSQSRATPRRSATSWAST